ncbi:ABC transporter ATP-binding protein [Methylobacterium oryzihabitans]|uniref:ABC transporter ATP-binding protein n=1 Tax=Methylobacterium oryzihabitans TaxID=2499852 RepID=A0A437NXV0_9HYPH|nr:ABC transporter ATP-binding protein [Methylobacterium oryzihabitans]RVU14844.1 ABC transporter ATP-binding protein [Methylobacterium oryzihabitans]
MTDLTVSHLVVHYGGVSAVEDVSFTVRSGEWVTLLGPSGCGKSTTLSAIAGLERPTSGRIAAGDKVYVDGATGTWLEPERRDLGLVFQSYALWPHMSVAENCAYPLKLRRIGRAERRDKVREALALVGMEAYADRYPHQLSGGQQQRVALARTLVYRPRVLLLDEPLSNLDARVRERARDWLKDLQKKVGLTTIFVTHDQVEALALSDRIIVMEAGRIVQDGTPTGIYERPTSRFVADFVGTMSFLPATLAEGGAVLGDGQRLALGAGHGRPAGGITLALRPEAVAFAPAGEGGLTGEVVTTSYLGGRYSHVVSVAGTPVRVEAERAVPPGPATLTVRPESVLVFPA